MTKKIKYDGVLEAAHFNTDGSLSWVRVYERRGAIFSDRILLMRKDFVEQLKAGKRYVVGERIFNMGGMFNTGADVRLVAQNGTQAVVVGDLEAAKDELPGVPVI